MKYFVFILFVVSIVGVYFHHLKRFEDKKRRIIGFSNQNMAKYRYK